MNRLFFVILSMVLTVIHGPIAIAGVEVRETQERRIALVAGVSDYQHLPKLRNPAGDARAVAQRLSALGFETTLAVDPTRDSLNEALSRFTDKAARADTCLIYFAGVSFVQDSSTLLASADTPADSVRALQSTTINADLILAETRQQGCRVVMLVDACRYEVAASSGRSGLSDLRAASPAAIPAGTIVAFAGEVGGIVHDGLPSVGQGQHGPFTWFLLRALETPDVGLPSLLAIVKDQVIAATRRTGKVQYPVIMDNLLTLSGDTTAGRPATNTR